jgi:hypothetical protein
LVFGVSTSSSLDGERSRFPFPLLSPLLVLIVASVLLISGFTIFTGGAVCCCCCIGSSKLRSIRSSYNYCPAITAPAAAAAVAAQCSIILIGAVVMCGVCVVCVISSFALSVVQYRVQ